MCKVNIAQLNQKKMVQTYVEKFVWGVYTHYHNIRAGTLPFPIHSPRRPSYHRGAANFLRSAPDSFCPVSIANVSPIETRSASPSSVGRAKSSSTTWEEIDHGWRELRPADCRGTRGRSPVDDYRLRHNGRRVLQSGEHPVPHEIRRRPLLHGLMWGLIPGPFE